MTAVSAGPDAIWSGWKLVVFATTGARAPTGRLKSSLEQKRNAQLWVINRLRELAPRAVVGDAQITGLQTVSDKLLDEIKQGFVGKEMQWRRNFLVAGLDRGRRQLRWEVDTPAPVVRLKQRGSPLTAANFSDIARFRRLRDALLNYLKTHLGAGMGDGAVAPLFGPTPREGEIGVMLLCAVAFGAAANRQTVQRIGQCLTNPSTIHVTARLVWVEWNEGGNGAPDRWGRWVADPLSSLVLARFLVERTPGQAVELPANDDPWPALRAALALINVDRDDLPTSLRMLMTWAAAWSYRYLPPFVAEYATGKLSSASLPPHAWRRLIERRPIAFTREGEPSQIPRTQVDTAAGAAGTATFTLRGAALALRTLIRKGIQRRAFGEKAPLARDGRGQPKYPPKLEKLRAEAREFTACSDVPMLVRLLADWIMSSVGRVQGKGASKRLTTMLRYLESIDYELCDEVGEEDILKLAGERRAEIYTRILERTRSAQRRNFRAASLAQFHAYLAHNFGVDDDLESVFDAVDVEGGVDANLISHREFRALLEQLMHQRGEPRLAIAQANVACTAYRATLRRGEVRQAQRGDIRGVVAPQLRVSPHRPDALKTHNAIRRIPLHEFLSDQERTLLRTYLHTLDREWAEWLSESPEHGSAIDRDSAPLFASPGTPTEVLSDRQLFDRIVTTLQAITGDRSIRFHHLRHSCLHLLILALLERLLPGALSWLMPDVDLAAVPLLRLGLMGSDVLSKQELWAVATVAGHSSPEVTLGSYFHLCDWLTYVALVPRAPSLIDEEIAQVTGLTHANVRQLRRRLAIKPHEWFRLALHGHPEFGSLSAKPADVSSLTVPTNPASEVTQASSNPDSVNDSSQPILLSATALIAIVAKLHASPDKRGALSREHGVPVELVQALGDVAEQLVSIVGKSRGQRDRRGQIAGAPASVKLGKLTIERPIRRRLGIRSRQQQVVTDALFDALARLESNDQNAFDEFATLYWRRRDFDDSLLRIGTRQDAKDVTKALRLLMSDNGAPLLASSNLKFEHEAFVEPGAPPAEHQVEQWSEAIGISRCQIFAATREVAKPQETDRIGYLRISIQGELKAHAAAGSAVTVPVARLGTALDAAMYAITLRRLASV